MVSDAMAQWVFEKSHYHGTGHDEDIEMSKSVWISMIKYYFL